MAARQSHRRKPNPGLGFGRRLSFERLERREVLTAAPGVPDLLAASDTGILSSDNLTNLNNAGNDLAVLDDDFSNAATHANWQRIEQAEGWNISQLQTWDINTTQPGRMVMIPHTVTWYQNYRGPMAFKEVTGNFIFTTEIHVSDRDDVGDNDADDVPDGATYSLGGVMIRTPRAITNPSQWTPGGEDYVFLSLGYGSSGSDFQFEVKTTDNSNSNLVLSTAGSNTATLRLARIGNAVVALRKLPGQDWAVHARYRRTDFPETMQLGLVTYSDYGKVSSFDPFYHNGHALIGGQVTDPSPGVPFRPDLVAGFEYTRYARPVVPVGLAGIDLFSQATDAQLLSFLGDNAGSTDPLAPLQFTVPGTIPGADVRVYAAGTLIGRAIATGTATVVTTGFGAKLADGTHQITATQRSPGDTVSVSSAALPTIIDTLRPTPTVTPLTTADGTPGLSGSTSETLSSLTVSVGNQTYPATLNGGSWSLADNTISSPMAGGVYDVQLTAVDLAGNQGTDVTTGELTIQNPALQATSFTATTTGFSVTFSEAIDSSTLNLYDQDNLLGPADVTLLGASTGTVRGSLVLSSDARTVTFIKTGEPLAADSYTVTLRSAASAFHGLPGNLLDGDSNGAAGGDYVRAFVVGAPVANRRQLSVPDFARGFGQAVHFPSDSANNLPITLNNAQGIGRVDFTLRYDPALLSITSASLPGGLAGATLSFDNSQVGLVTISITSPTALSNTTDPLTLVQLTASVPSDAPYSSKHVLDLSDIHVFTAGPTPSELPTTDDDGIHLAAYFGDTNGSQSYNAPDATLAQRLIVGMVSGFTSYASADPHLLGDITSNGVLQSNDVTAIQQAIVGIANTAIPPLPGLPLQTGSLVAGPDPVVFIPKDMSASVGETIQVPIELLVTEPTGISLTGGDVAVNYDPAQLQLTGVVVGKLLVGFGLNVYQTGSGVVKLSFASSSPLELASGTLGTLMQLQFTVVAGTSGQAILNLLGESGSLTTALYDGDQPLTLAPGPTNFEDDVVDGLLEMLSEPDE